MAKRDPEKTARNKIAQQITDELKILEPNVLNIAGVRNVESLHGKIGGKFADYIDIQNAVITSPEHFISLYIEGFESAVESLKNRGLGDSAQCETYDLIKSNPEYSEYLYKFLHRVYLRHYDSLSKCRPRIQDAEVWIGQNNADYGLLISPRFSNGQWENDKSEIRKFRYNYWSIGHILETGLVIPGKKSAIEFKDIDEYLNFFENVLVRGSGSVHEAKIAELYSKFVREQTNPNEIPLLIPEFRYGGIAKAHKYRVDFTIINATDLTKYGFELSPWSTHGYLSKTKQLNQTQINEMAQGNFEKEMKKHKQFFRKHGLFIRIYTDDDLSDIDSVFEDMKKYLVQSERATQLKFHIIRDFFSH